MSIAANIVASALIANRQGARCDQLFMNPRDFAEVKDTLEFSVAEDRIRALGGTHQERTTRLGRLSAARRMAVRRGRRFQALEWQP